MIRTSILVLLAILLTGPPVSALEITSVTPLRATPASPVVLSGGPFSLQSRIYLGEQYVPALQVLPRQLVFVVPPLPAGTYSLTVQDDSAAVQQPVNFEVLTSPPQILALEPQELDACSDGAERVIRVKGRNLVRETLLLLDGNVINSSFIDAGNMEFRLPDLAAGVYGVMVRNPDGTASLPHSLWIDNIPEITGVERGDDFVNHYEVIIRGKNFFHNSILVVTVPDASGGRAETRQLTYYANRGATPGFFAMLGEELRYLDCRTLLYLRFPGDTLEKELAFQVINPDGKKTAPYEMTLP